MSNLPISLRSILITGFGALLALMLCTLLVLWAWRADDIATIALALALLAFGMLLGAWMIQRVLDHETAWGLAADQAEATWRAMGDGVIRVRADGCIDAMNAVAERYTGWTAAAARGQPLDVVYRLVEDQTGLPLLHQENAGRGSRALVMQLLHRDGTLCAVRDSMARLPAATAVATTTATTTTTAAAEGWVVVFHDVTEIEQMARQLSWQASHDSLTGLINRREFELRLRDLLESARNDGVRHALLYLDLDHFKVVNDSCGHAAGDEMLRQLTAVMQLNMRGSDALARLGGDEFGVLLTACPLEQAVRIANAMREAVREFRFVWEARSFGVSVSAGLVDIDGSEPAENVLAAADRICYEAKSRGRDRVQVHRPGVADGGGESTDLKMVSRINHAFDLDKFRLYRQKIVAVNAADGDAPHYEILVRMLDANGQLVAPAVFMPAAERYNLLNALERWVIRTLVEFLAQQCANGVICAETAGTTTAFYAVNLSGASINDASFLDFMRDLFSRHALPRGLLCFEITETTAISNLQNAAAMMGELKILGCRFALDDFGVGMSSFAYLKSLPVDYIKIDGVFIRGMANDPMDQAIVENINRTAHLLGLKTVAEFVEDGEILERLREIGVDYAQGHYIAKAVALVPPSASEPAVLEPL